MAPSKRSKKRGPSNSIDLDLPKPGMASSASPVPSSERSSVENQPPHKKQKDGRVNGVIQPHSAASRAERLDARNKVKVEEESSEDEADEAAMEVVEDVDYSNDNQAEEEVEEMEEENDLNDDEEEDQVEDDEKQLDEKRKRKLEKEMKRLTNDVVQEKFLTTNATRARKERVVIPPVGRKIETSYLRKFYVRNVKYKPYLKKERNVTKLVGLIQRSFGRFVQYDVSKVFFRARGEQLAILQDHPILSQLDFDRNYMNTGNFGIHVEEFHSNQWRKKNNYNKKTGIKKCNQIEEWHLKRTCKKLLYMGQKIYLQQVAKKRFEKTMNAFQLAKGIRVYVDEAGEENDITTAVNPNKPISDYNVVNENDEKLLMLEQLSKEEAFQIHCNCAAEKKECFQNPNCPCFQADQTLRDGTKTPKPACGLKLERIHNSEAYVYAFRCSKGCACEGRCCQNPLYPVEVQYERVEIVKNARNMKGYTVRNLGTITKGQAVTTISGVASMKHSSEKDKDEDDEYSLEVNFVHELQATIKSIITQMNISEDLKKHALEAYGAGIKQEPGDKIKVIDDYQTLCINAGEMLSVGRFVSHSCTPNMGLAVVYQGNFAPTSCQVAFFALRDIPPGEELTFDYGIEYVLKKFKDTCACGAPWCIRASPTMNMLNKKHIKDFYKLVYEAIVLRIIAVHDNYEPGQDYEDDNENDDDNDGDDNKGNDNDNDDNEDQPKPAIKHHMVTRRAVR